MRRRERGAGSFPPLAAVIARFALDGARGRGRDDEARATSAKTARRPGRPAHRQGRPGDRRQRHAPGQLGERNTPSSSPFETPASQAPQQAPQGEEVFTRPRLRPWRPSFNRELYGFRRFAPRRALVSGAPGPVAIIMGSQSDWAVMRRAAETPETPRDASAARSVPAPRTPHR